MIFAARRVAAQAAPARMSSALEGGIPSEPSDPLPIIAGVIGRGARQGQVRRRKPASGSTAPLAVVQQAYRWLTNDTATPGAWTPLGAIFNAHDAVEQERQAQPSTSPSMTRISPPAW